MCESIETTKAAAEYVERGWAIIPIPLRAKRPQITGWPDLRIDRENLYQYFNGHRQNIGVILGDRSNGLVDVDIDSLEAVKLADWFLPKTRSIFGRPSKPSSHRLYICPDAEYQKFTIPRSLSDGLASDTCIVEIRTGRDGKGIQTVFPPSVHECGETIEWVSNGSPLEIERVELFKSVSKLAAACLLVKCWRKGIRHDLSLVISGVLLKKGWVNESVKLFLRSICHVSGDDEVDDRMRCVDDSEAAIAKERKVFGIPKLIELTDQKIVDSLCEWLEIDGSTDQLTINSSNRPRLSVVCMKDIEPKEIKWLWKPYIPLGEFTIIEGIEGIGKSWIGCALAKAVASGARLPFHDEQPLDPGTVLLLSAEDSLSHTLRPRLDSMEADVSRIFAFETVFSLNDDRDLIGFEERIAEYRPRLVFIDPMFSYTSGKDLNSESASRPIARGLIALAQKYECAIVGVRHVGKSKGQGDARNAGLGSTAWRASARSVLLVGQDNDSGERGICQTKNNLSQESKICVGFDIVDGRFTFSEMPSSLTKERMLAQTKDPETKARHTEAVEFLREALSSGPRLSKEIDDEAQEQGITAYRLRNAKKTLGVKPFKTGGTFGGGLAWYLRMSNETEDVVANLNRPIQPNSNPNPTIHKGLPEDVEISRNEQLQTDSVLNHQSHQLLPEVFETSSKDQVQPNGDLNSNIYKGLPEDVEISRNEQLQSDSGLNHHFCTSFTEDVESSQKEQIQLTNSSSLDIKRREKRLNLECCCGERGIRGFDCRNCGAEINEN